jgi:hypothetical protein
MSGFNAQSSMYQFLSIIGSIVAHFCRSEVAGATESLGANKFKNNKKKIGPPDLMWRVVLLCSSGLEW